MNPGKYAAGAAFRFTVAALVVLAISADSTLANGFGFGLLFAAALGDSRDSTRHNNQRARQENPQC